MYAAGSRDSASTARFEARLRDGCEIAASEYAGFAETATALLCAALPLHSPPPGLRERLLDRIGAAEQSAAVVTRATDARWLPGPAPGVEICLLRGKKTMLVRLSPGACVPAHHHTSDEQCLVLEGTLSDGEITVQSGDFVYMPAGSTHRELSSVRGCTFLIAYA